MESTTIKALAITALSLIANTALAVEPEVVYSFRLGPATPQGGLVEGNDGSLYGVTQYGGSADSGTVFSVATNGTLTTLVSFTGTNGLSPQAGLVRGADGSFYGTTYDGGTESYAYGTAFRLTADGTLTTLASFNGTNGGHPSGKLLTGVDGSLYGTTWHGGTSNAGTVFRLTTNGVLTTLVWFNYTNGAYPYSGLITGSDGTLFGTTSAGGSSAGDFFNPGGGTVFKITPEGVMTTLVSFTGGNGFRPNAGLVFGNDGNLYGTTRFGGNAYLDSNHPGDGTAFKVSTNGALTTLVSFDYSTGTHPTAGLVFGADGDLYGTTSAGSISLYGTFFRLTTTGALTTLGLFGIEKSTHPASELIFASDGNLYGTIGARGDGKGTVFRVTTNGVISTVTAFPTTDGEHPLAELMPGDGNDFFGTTYWGGGKNLGTVFRVTANGALTTLATFTGTNGAHPAAGLVRGSGGNIYGTTRYGGIGGYGTVFRMTSGGELTTLLSFYYTNGAYPRGRLLLGLDGNFYGTTSGDGTNNFGTMFRMSPDGEMATLAWFNNTNGSQPLAGLASDSGGNLYGTTYSGGSNGYGTVFKATPAGVLTTLVSFNHDNGAWPMAGLVAGPDGHFYGTTSGDGYRLAGTAFRVTADGALTSLGSFNTEHVAAGLVFGRDGNCYGTTEYGSTMLGWPLGTGSVFQISTNGNGATLFSFNNNSGRRPQAGLVVGGDGNLYGTTGSSGPGGGGTIFRVVIRPAITAVKRLKNGSVVVSGSGLPSNAFGLRVSPSISLPLSSWTLLTNVVVGSGYLNQGTFSYLDAEAATNPARFYLLTAP